MDTDTETVVVGGGQAGLAMGYHLRRRGRPFVVLDAGPEIGHVWRSRWDSLRLFTPARYAGLPGMPFPAAPDAYPTKDEVADYVLAYAAAFDLPVRSGARVAAVEPAPAGYLLRLGDDTLHARSVVIATGPFAVPVFPPVGAALGAGVLQLRSAAYRSPRQVPAGPVLVVGGGNSGFQIAADLAATLPVGRRNAVVPQRILGRDIF